MLKLSIREARRLMIGAQLLSGNPPKRPTKQNMRDTIRHLGAVQIDSISVVQRSHHIVLWSRLGNHPPDWLNELLADDRAVFEYWVHAAAYAPIEHFPYFRRKMIEFSQRHSKWTRDWIAENKHVLDQVMEYVRANGPVTSKSFDAPSGAGRAEPWAWYGNKPTNLALEILWSTGDLMVTRRDSFQRVYDLTERVLPDWDDSRLPHPDEERRALVLATLNALGVSTARWIPDYFRRNHSQPRVERSLIAQTLEELVEEGLAVRGEVKGIADPVYISGDALNRRFRPSRTTLLSSFDSLVWDRKRTKEMFDFDLQLEAYTPKHKRIYGYYSLPILYRDQLVGRLDPKAHRKTGELTVNALHLEPWFEPKADDRFYQQLAASLNDFARFNQTDHVTVHVSNPPEARERLLAALGEAEMQP